ncbi:HNH endonuclease signature motif containing protein, partial [Nocardioides sp.]
HVVDGPAGAATLTAGFLDTGIPIAGPGAPLVSEFGLMELIATLERSPDGGRAYVGRVIECAWRLPGIYAAVLDGRCSTYRAEQVADLTRPLSRHAAAHVDGRLRGFVGTCTFAQIQRLVTEAISLHDPDLAEARRADAADGRRFDVDLDQLHAVDAHGLVHVDGLLDAADGADLDTAIRRRAVLLGKLGHHGTLDVRRAVAVGELARNDLTLDLEVVDEETGEVTVAAAGRRAVLHIHLADTAITHTSTDAAAGGAPVGRWEDRQTPISVEQIREWLQTPGTSITVKPVIDLADHVPVDSYEIPDRLRERVRLRDHTCRYPWCPRQATRCDLDHARPHTRGGVTCPCNLVPLCRRHHRAKTHSAWRYAVIDPGTYLWTSPHHRHYLVDQHGTHALDPPDH